VSGWLLKIGPWMCWSVLLSIPGPQGFSHAAPGAMLERAATQSISTTHERRELAPEEYKKLRAQTLANARMWISPRIRDPRLGDRGLETAVLNALAEQRTYLQGHKSKVSSGTNTPQSKLKNLASYTSGVSSSSSRAPDQRTSPQREIARASDPKEISQPPATKNICQAPGIRSVSGKLKGAVFTPQPPDNSYKIEGCFFGDQPGQVQLDLRPSRTNAKPQPIILQLDSPYSWTASEINAHIDPSLTGISDAAATLVIYPVKGQRVEMPDCSFVAARGEPRLLSFIPSSWVTLDPTRVRSRAVDKLEYVSPPVQGGDVPSDAVGSSAVIIRSDFEKFSSATDSFDFSHLLNGWVVESVQLQTYSVSCPGTPTNAESFGKWHAENDRHKVTVNWESEFCAWSVAPFSGFSMGLSEYAFKVWVIGPRDTEYMPAKENP
jgi:hypothetical protein